MIWLSWKIKCLEIGRDVFWWYEFKKKLYICIGIKYIYVVFYVWLKCEVKLNF